MKYIPSFEDFLNESTIKISNEDKAKAKEILKKKRINKEEREFIKKVYPSTDALHLDYEGNNIWVNNTI